MKPQKGADKTAEKTSTIKVGKDSGRVKVFVRVRPPRPQENSRKEPIAVNALELSSQIHVLDPKHSWEKTFNFDHVFPQESTNPEVCSTISRPLVNAALNGFNGTLMAYGQTGSGKTHTLMAPDGITAGVIERCFKRITMDDRHDYKVTMSYLQIYQEKIYDLLNSTNKVELSLREHPMKGVYVENLSEYVVRSPSEVLNLLAVGKKRLIFAETKMNRTSSRSHSVCQLRIERTLNKSKAPSEGSGKDGVTKQGVHPKDSPAGCSKKSQGLPGESADTVTGSKEDLNEEDGSVVKMVAFDDDVLIRGRIYLCDLAGSERLKKTQAEGERLSEAQHINSSLLELGNVIQALADGKKTHVPFRNSTLTRLLQESLGGNCKTSLVVCVSPTASDVSETKSALFFGSRAMKITNTAYVNVEVDYQRLSEDLSKIVDMREKDLVELRQSYETRIERMKHEAETTVTNSMAEAEKLVASVKSLYENQQSSLQNDLENLQTSLEEEKARAENHHREITDVRCKLKKDMHRSRTVLLMDIVSMQLLCAIKKLSLQDGSSLPTCKTDIKANGNHCTAARSKILENTDVLLKLFKSYLRLMNSKGNELLENGATLRCMVELCDEKTELCDTNDVLCDADDVSLYLANKTDDDKVVASSLVESRDDCVPPGGEVLFEDDEYSKLRDKLASLKESIDSEALEFLSKAFELDQEGKDQTLESRQDIYNRIKEFMERRSSFSDTSGSSEVSSLADAVTLLDHCHSHVLVDKALQSALLLLENTSITRRCREVSMQKGAVEKENEALKSQVQSLQSEAENLNGKLTETSTKLCDVKKSKEQLEDDLSSVFQLYNMRDNGREEATENGGESQLDGVHDIPAKLHAEISTLVENNVKLIEELAATEKEKENLESQLTCTKVELEKEKAKSRALAADRHCKSTQTEETEEEGDSIESQDQDLLARFLSVLNDDYSALEKAAYAAQTNAIGDVSSLRTVINQRLGEEWSLMVLENAKMKSELVNIRGRIEEEKESFESQLTNLEMEELSQRERHNVERNGCREEEVESLPKFEKSFENGVGDTKTFDIMIYDQNKVIAKLEMDKLELVKGLQRFKQDSENRRKMSSGGGNDCNADDKIVGDSQATDSSLEEENGLGDILKEKLQDLLKFQQENQSINDELVALRSKYNSLEKDNHDSNKSRERLEQRLESLIEGEKHLSSNILEMRDGYAKVEEKLAQASTEKSELREELKELEQKTNEAEQERDAIKRHKTVLEEKLAQVSKEKSELREQLKEMERKAKEAEQKRDAIKHHKTVLEEILLEDAKRAERVLASEKGQRSVCEERLREKTKEFEESRTLLKLSENRLSKMDKELSETKKSCELLQESVNELEGERENLIKEINSLRCLQGLPTVNLKPISSKGLPQKQTASKGAPKRQQNKQGNKLNSELTRAKEQLVRLKAELTLSNMQTRNLGSQLSSLREDSTKLEAELSTVRVSPTRLRPRRNSFSCYDETVRLEMELAEAKGKIIELQEKLLSIYKEKFVLEEKLLSCDLQVNKEKEVAVTGQIDDKENGIKDEKTTLESCAGDEAEKPFEAQRAIAHEQQEFDSEEKKNLEKKINLLEVERTQLKKELESTNVDKCRLEGIECCIQQLVTLEDDKLRLQRKLKHWAQGGPDDKDLNTASEKQEQSKKVENTVTLKKAASKTFKSDLLAEIKDLSTENYALQEEAESLKEKVIELEGALTALKFKVSVQDTVQDATADKKALATLLASVKQERNGLQQAVQELLGEKDDVEEELAGIKAKYSNVQRELAMTSMMKDDLELELSALKNANLTRGFSSQTQSSDDCRSELSDSSFDDMVFFSAGGQLLSPEPCSIGNTLLVPSQEHKQAVTRNGKKPVNGSITRKATTARNQRDGNVSSSSNGSLSSSSGINQIGKKASLPKQRNSARSQTTGSKASGRRILPSEPRSERLGKAFPRFNTDDNQSPTDNTQQSAISFDLVRIDDVTDDTPNADSDCTDSGLFRETPEGERENPETPAGERENPEGMEDEEMDDKTLIPLHETTNGDKEDKTVITAEKAVDLEKHLVPVLTISELGSEFQVDEVLVKTTWSLKNFFRRQKSLPLPDIGVGALKQ